MFGNTEKAGIHIHRSRAHLVANELEQLRDGEGKKLLIRSNISFNVNGFVSAHRQRCAERFRGGFGAHGHRDHLLREVLLLQPQRLLHSNLTEGIH